MNALAAFGLDAIQFDVAPFGSGHINKTYLAKARNGGDHYVLQQINTNVFKRPEVIAANQRRTGEYLSRTQPSYLFLRALPTKDGADLWTDPSQDRRPSSDGSGCPEAVWRLMPYVADTLTVNQAESPKQAYEAAKQFGRFARFTAKMDIGGMEPTIVNFHNLTLRVRQFEDSLNGASEERKTKAAVEIDAIRVGGHIAERYAAMMQANVLPKRLMHHDTKINNVLIHAGTHAGVCLVDLDTLMPGVILSDLGDMVRTYVCPVSEEESDVSRVQVQDEFFAALVAGYVSEMRGELTVDEKEVLFYAGQFMIYMQAVRFLADYLNGDVYYPVKHTEHNLDRARNQITLLTRLNEKEQSLRKSIREYL